MKEKRKDNPSATISIRMKEKQDEKFLVLLCWKKGKLPTVDTIRLRKGFLVQRIINLPDGTIGRQGRRIQKENVPKKSYRK